MLQESLQVLRTRLKANQIGGLNERNTDRAFVSPLLETLGYDLSNLEETMAAYSIKGLDQGAEISYAFFLHNSPLLLVEVRPLYSDLNNIKSIAKILTTAKASPAKFLAVCNGVHWYLYNVENEQSKLGMIIDINDAEAAEQLQLLSKNSIRERLLDTYLSEHNVKDVKNENGPMKTRGYRVDDYTHNTLCKLRTDILANREVKDQEISNNLILKKLLHIIFESLDYFNYDEISNEVILKKRFEEALRKKLKV